MAFRDDHDAALARADALERQLVVVERERRDLARGRRKPVDWQQVAPITAMAVVSAAFTGLALTLGWGTWWAVAGFALVLLSILGLVGATGTDMPHGAVPVRASLEVGGRTLAVAAVVRLATADDGKELQQKAQAAFNTQSHEQVAAVATAAVEAAVRAAGGAGPDGAALTAAVEPGARERLAQLGLVLAPGALWVAPR